jgi:hypothetical protein
VCHNSTWLEPKEREILKKMNALNSCVMISRKVLHQKRLFLSLINIDQEREMISLFAFVPHGVICRTDAMRDYNLSESVSLNNFAFLI